MIHTGIYTLISIYHVNFDIYKQDINNFGSILIFVIYVKGIFNLMVGFENSKLHTHTHSSELLKYMR